MTSPNLLSLKYLLSKEMLHKRLSQLAPMALMERYNYNVESLQQYTRNSKEMQRLENSLLDIKSKVRYVPITINGQEVRTHQVRLQNMPHQKKDALAEFCYADEKIISNAISQACAAQEKWQMTSFTRRVGIWETAANVIAKKRRTDMVGAIMLGQAKTVMEAEKDVVRLIDTIRLHTQFLRQLDRSPGLRSESQSSHSFIHFRALDGFVGAITPFYCTATAATLALAPALMGCPVLWKPHDAAILSNWLVFQIMRESGLPEGVINFIPADELTFLTHVTRSPSFIGLNFTGSLETYQSVLHNVTQNLHHYLHIPHIHCDFVDNKNFHFIHRSANADVAVACTVRAAFEYSGQKPDSCSHIFVSDRLWADDLARRFTEVTQRLFVGDVTNFKSFLSAVIDEKAFSENYDFVETVKIRNKGQIIAGGVSCPLKGYFMDPTIVVVLDPRERLLRQSVAGPIIIVHPYRERNTDKVIMFIEQSGVMRSGAAFAEDPQFLRKYVPRLQNSSIRYFINDSCTGDVERQLPLVGQPHQLLRWTRIQSLRQTLQPANELFYACMNMS